MVSSPQHEPTMEEILASIRKIISEDSTEQPPEAEAKPAPVEPEPEADILDLTQEVAAEPAPPPPPPEPVAAVVPPAAPENDVVFEPIEELKPEPEPAPVAPAGGIFSDKTRQSFDDAFAAIDQDDEEDEEPALQPVSYAATATGATVEAVFERAVREAFLPVTKEWLSENAGDLAEKMKPLIRTWMDEHFPAILEVAIRDEVARVVKARGSKR